jgi:hypothetical protein
MKVIAWRIYYGDGSTYSSLDGGWKQSSPVNVQAVVVFYAETYHNFDNDGVLQQYNYRRVHHSQEYYWMEGVEPNSGDAKKAPMNPDPGTVKDGGALTKELFREVYDAARADMKW